MPVSTPSRIKLIARYPDRRFQTDYGTLLGVVVRSGTGALRAWYEFFPRSAASGRTRTARYGIAKPDCPKSSRWASRSVLSADPSHGACAVKSEQLTDPAAEDLGIPWAIGARRVVIVMCISARHT